MTFSCWKCLAKLQSWFVNLIYIFYYILICQFWVLAKVTFSISSSLWKTLIQFRCWCEKIYILSTKHNERTVYGFSYIQLQNRRHAFCGTCTCQNEEINLNSDARWNAVVLFTHAHFCTDRYLIFINDNTRLLVTS